MKVYLIRHSMTEGNRVKRYIGSTDEPLCEDGKAVLSGRFYPAAERLYVSPMLRCRETAQIIYPNMEQRLVPELRECDFGMFENKNYMELSGCPEYQAWIDSEGKAEFPGGEHPEEFKMRSVQVFAEVISACQQEGIESVAFVVHGGTIMSVMEKYARPKGIYYDFYVGNGEGYELIFENVCTGDRGLCTGPDHRGSALAVSSGSIDRTSDYEDGTNYKTLCFERKNPEWKEE